MGIEERLIRMQGVIIPY